MSELLDVKKSQTPKRRNGKSVFSVDFDTGNPKNVQITLYAPINFCGEDFTDGYPIVYQGSGVLKTSLDKMIDAFLEGAETYEGEWEDHDNPHHLRDALIKILFKLDKFIEKETK